MTATQTGHRALAVNRDDLRDRRIIEQAQHELEDGQLRVRVDRFAITANNATYGAFGHAYRYWDFFPVPDGLGCVPVWGYGDVIESRNADIANGERLFGFWPMAEQLVIRPTRLRPDSLTDGSAHRADLPAVYNSYARCVADPQHDPDFETERMLLFPLFTTSFLLADFCRDNEFFGADTIAVTSASSKTAIGTAFVLRRFDGKGVNVIGLTSAGNRPYVESLGFYDDVLVYDDIVRLPAARTVLLEFSGNANLVGAIHRRLDDNLSYSCRIGAAHFTDTPAAGSGPLPGPRPQPFFAPSQIQKRYQDWGADGYARRFGSHWLAFATASRDWITVEEGAGLEAADAVFERFLDGTADPDVGYVISLPPR